MTSTDPHGAHAIKAALAGDSAALERVADRALEVALGTAVALLGDRERAADVAQDVALLAVRRLASVRDPMAFDAWVHRTALRESVRAERQGRRQAAHERPLDADSTDLEVAAHDGGDIELRLAIAERLQALPQRQRAAVVLRYVHDLSDEEIAMALRCRVGTVHALLSRARSTLREDPVVRPLNPARVGEAR